MTDFRSKNNVLHYALYMLLYVSYYVLLIVHIFIVWEWGKLAATVITEQHNW